ncbi:MAG TPA: hypothetical protein VLH08_16245 [Acidobacteriota bacterium]|nr:hypothetical protein [Acidobacteriota bacterium]
MKRLLFLLLLLILATPVYSLRKPHFGGNLRVADTLINRINNESMFSVENETIKPLVPVPAEIDDKQIQLDFSGVNPEWFVELEKAVADIQDENNSCHWILDYPYFDHRHPTKIKMEAGTLIVESEELDYLHAILTSRCLPPGQVELFQPFRKTQFGYEANTNCIYGRPFLDSITPSPIDPANPYLSFKLNDVDVLPVPEERFQQIQSDSELNVIDGPSFFVYLTTSNLKAEDVARLTSGTRIAEIAKVVLNDHAEILLSQPASSGIPASKTNVEFKVSQEDPYRLLGERLILEWQELGFTQGNGTAAKIEVNAQEVIERDQDLFRYNILRTQFHVTGSKPWFEVWDEMESSGKIVPLLLHKTRIALRKNVVNSRSNGNFDFANAWIIPEQQ